MNEDEGKARIVLLAALPRMVQIRKPHRPSMRQAGGRRRLQVFASLKLTWTKLTWMSHGALIIQLWVKSASRQKWPLPAPISLGERPARVTGQPSERVSRVALCKRLISQ